MPLTFSESHCSHQRMTARCCTPVPSSCILQDPTGSKPRELWLCVPLPGVGEGFCIQTEARQQVLFASCPEGVSRFCFILPPPQAKAECHGTRGEELSGYSQCLGGGAWSGLVIVGQCSTAPASGWRLMEQQEWFHTPVPGQPGHLL